jgi:hypothetical protein
MSSSLPKPEVICTHESDLDGLVSGLLLQRLARKLFEAEVPLEAYHYQGWKNRPLTEKSAWICDFAFEARFDRPNWVVLDHHVTSAVARQARFIHDPGKSAALLCYELCLAEGLGTPRLDRLVHLTNVGDLFLVNDPDFALSMNYANLVKTYGFWPLLNLSEGDPERLYDHPLLEVMAVKSRVEDPLGYEWVRQRIDVISPTIGLVHPLVGNTNLIVHRLLESKATPYTVLVSLFRRGNGPFIASFRSQNGEAIKVAAQLQGGGHPNAAGTTLPQSVRDVAAAAAYLRQVLNPKLPAAGLNSMENALAGLKL